MDGLLLHGSLAGCCFTGGDYAIKVAFVRASHCRNAISHFRPSNFPQFNLEITMVPESPAILEICLRGKSLVSF